LCASCLRVVHVCLMWLLTIRPLSLRTHLQIRLRPRMSSRSRAWFVGVLATRCDAGSALLARSSGSADINGEFCSTWQVLQSSRNGREHAGRSRLCARGCGQLKNDVASLRVMSDVAKRYSRHAISSSRVGELGPAKI
jgi:hypothetical protein